MTTVRQATFALATELGMTTWFGNPGSTEVPLLADLPAELSYLLALHEGPAVAMAAGFAIAKGRPQLVSLHTAAGLGHAVSAIITARVTRAPLVVLVGQQDRRHLEFEPFLTGRLAELAGSYPVAVHQPARAQAVPGALARAWHEAGQGRGPVLLVVPMDDWEQPMDGIQLAAPSSLIRASSVAPQDVAPLAELVAGSRSPVLVAGAGADSRAGWEAMIELAERLGCPVWQEPFGSRAGFPQDHPQFQGFLPAGRSELRRRLAGHDLVLVVGAGVLRQYHYEPGPLFAEGTISAVISDDPSEAARSAARLALLGPIPAACRELAKQLPGRPPAPPKGASEQPLRRISGTDELLPEDVFALLEERIDRDTIVVEESPSSRDALQRMLPAREPLGYLSAAMGGLGFALGAAAGLRLADPERPVLALVGDGSSLYGFQALWSAAHYGAGVLYVILRNGSYRIMDNQANARGGAPWPGFEEVQLAALARALGCEAERIESREDLLRTLDQVVPSLRQRRSPLLLEVPVGPTPEGRR